MYLDNPFLCPRLVLIWEVPTAGNLKLLVQCWPFPGVWWAINNFYIQKYFSSSWCTKHQCWQSWGRRIPPLCWPTPYPWMQQTPGYQHSCDAPHFCRMDDPLPELAYPGWSCYPGGSTPTNQGFHTFSSHCISQPGKHLKCHGFYPVRIDRAVDGAAAEQVSSTSLCPCGHHQREMRWGEQPGATALQIPNRNHPQALYTLYTPRPSHPARPRAQQDLTNLFLTPPTSWCCCLSKSWADIGKNVWIWMLSESVNDEWFFVECSLCYTDPRGPSLSAPLHFSDGEAAAPVSPVPGLQCWESWLTGGKKEHYCQATLSSAYCKPRLPIAKLPQNLKIFFHQSWKNKIIADLFNLILMWISAALNSALNGFRGKDEPKKTLVICTEGNLKQRHRSQWHRFSFPSM